MAPIVAVTRAGWRPAAQLAAAAGAARSVWIRQDPATRMMSLVVAIYSLSYLLNGGTGIYDTHKDLAYITHTKDLGLMHSLGAYWWAPSSSISWYPAIAQSHDFVAIPETTLFSPLTPLVAVVSAQTYFKVFVVAHAIAGLAGCRLLTQAVRRRWSIGNPAVPMLVLGSVVILGPFVPQHIAIGYLPWATFWLLPILLYGLAARDRWHGTAVAALTLGVVILEGGSHVAFLMLPVLVGWVVADALLTRNGDGAFRAGLMLVLGAGVSAVRLLPTAARFADFHQAIQPAFGVGQLVSSLFHFPVTWGVGSYSTIAEVRAVPAWDATVFMAPIVTVAGVWCTRSLVMMGHWSRRTLTIVALLACSAITFALALNGVYESVVDSLRHVSRSLPPRLAAAEKYPFRLAVPACVLLAVAAMLALDSIGGGHRVRSRPKSAERVYRRLTQISGSMRATYGVGLLLTIAGAVVILVGALHGRAWVDFSGPADPRQALIWVGVGLVAAGVVVITVPRVSVLLVLLVLGSTLASMSWWALGTSARKNPGTDIADATLAASPVTATLHIGERTLRLSTARQPGSVAVQIPPGDATAARLSSGTFTRDPSGAITGFACPAQATCTLRIQKPPLAVPFALSVAVAGVLLGVIASRRPRRGRIASV
jgi:hypothetical protein